MSRATAAIREVDLRMVERYKDFLPKQIFDAHIHMYGENTIPMFYNPDGNFFRTFARPENYWEDMQALYPGVEKYRLNMMAMPDRVFNDPNLHVRDQANEHIAKLLLEQPQHVGSAYVMYSDDEQKIGDMVSKPGFRALKCYCYTPRAEFSTNLAISEFLPESAWVVANEKKLPIVLHLMRPSGLSDEENFSYIMEKTKQYSDAKLVLAHCARGFVSWTVVDQIRKLVDRDNIWFDMAAICEVGPMMAAYMHSAGKRIVWGTDWPICLYRGRAISMGISQQWLTNDDPTVGYGLLAAESLMAFHQTASLLNLDQTQVDDIFYHNAVNLFGVQ